MAKKLEVVLTGNSRGVSKAFGDVERRAGGFQSKMVGIGSKVGRAMSIGLAGATVAFGGFVAGGLTSLANIEKIAAQTESAIQSTGGVAGVSAKHIDAYAHALEAKTGIEAESITTGQNLLLTFTNIRNSKLDKTFDNATMAALDMSKALGTDMKSSSILVGKALNDPIKGLTALSRVGVSFTAQQKDQIKAMVASGDTLGAQKVILKELNREFGGSAEAFGKTTSGKVAKLKNAFGDVQEAIALKLLPIGLKLLTWASVQLPKAFTRLQGQFRSMLPAIQSVGDRFRSIADAIAPVVAAIGRFVKANPKPVLIGVGVALGVVAAAWTAMAIAEAAALWPVYAVIAGIALLAGGLVYAYQKVGWFHDAVDAVAGFLRDTVWPIVQQVAQVVGEKLVAAFQWAAAFTRETLIPAMQALWVWFSDNILPAIRDVAAFVQDVLVVAFRTYSAYLSNILIPALMRLYGWFRDFIFPVLKTVSEFLVGGFAKSLAYTADSVQSVISKLRTVWDFLGRIKDAASGAFDWIKNLGSGGLAAVIPGFAVGGNAPVGMPYIVGERGPELRIDSRPGVIIPNHQLRAAASGPSAAGGGFGGGGGSTTVVIQLDSAEIARHTITSQNRSTRSTGRSPVLTSISSVTR